ncbi:SDR family oxidoreductase [Chryseobacterium hagamense]|uniref:Putative NAD-dependent epimerase/dehydratase n=1 Tax=Chryseobacterium hagamense TaxID=395935 RepID=A0A511YJS4_9FLAO|nr:SDR family oxidoreductase [Chryseobacterium hagamense]GEN75396.1 putative NAD-dependent epimerase/dehydratase [Chryseobacterium hagamense]
MKVFVTGASGFVGSAVVQELINAGHQVIGLARSEESAKSIREAGAEVLSGGLEDLDVLKQGASLADGIIHTAFIHDFSQYHKSGEVDETAIRTMAEAVKESGKPMVVTAGLLGQPLINGFITEESSADHSLRKSETTALALAEGGADISVIRLPPSVHDLGDKGFVPFIIGQARKNGVSAYPADEKNWSAVHRLDAARAYRLAVEKGARGAIYNVVGDSSIPLREIATVIGEKLNLPVQPLSEVEMENHFDWLSRFLVYEGAATGTRTREALNWEPQHPGLLEDITENYFI